MPPPGNVVYLVRPTSSKETKERLAELLADDDVIGLAYVAWRHGQFGFDVVGAARRNPLLTRVMVLMLEEELRRMVLGTATPR